MSGRNIRIRKDDSWTEHGWTAVPNSILRDATISWDARAAFAWLASHSMEFALSADSLAEAGPKGRNHARDMLRELERHGWLTRHKARNPENGRYDDYVYHLHPVQVPDAERTFVESTAKSSKPFPRASETENPRLDPATEQPGAGQPGAGEPGAGQSGVSRARLSFSLEDNLLTEEEDQTTAREPIESAALFPIDGPSGLDPEQAAAEWDAKQRRRSRSTQAMDRLNSSAHRPGAVPIVDRFEKRTNRLSRSEKGKWWVAVSNLLDLQYSEDVIDAAMDRCIADGVGWGLLESKALIVANQMQVAARTRPATSDRRMSEIDALLERRAAARVAVTHGSAAEVLRPEIEAPR